jgi:CubicO group peptidase (beta-lactamase class C family)
MHFSLNLPTPLHLFAALLLSAPCLPAKKSIYFPPIDGQWETVDPASAGWDQAKLDKLISSVGDQKSSGLLILLNGKILAEKYWPEDNYKTDGFRGVRMMLGETKDGQSIEDVASAQKSISALIVGIAQEKGLLSINNPVHKHLGKGWSRATPEQEDKITVKHFAQHEFRTEG